ncbi:MAG: tetratricopeptide repeat protein [Bryobacteraceae bacterium]
MMTWLIYIALLAQSPDLIEQGTQALEAKQYDRAVELYSKAAAADPADPFPEFQIALIYNELARDREAVPHYEAALKASPGLLEAEANLGMTLVRLKEDAAAVPHLEAALAKKPTPAAESSYALAVARQGRFSDAELHFRKAAAMDAAYKDSLLELAEVYELAGKNGEAIALYREFPQNAAAQARVGALLGSLGKDADAIPALEAAVTKSPTDANMVTLAQAYLRTKQTDKALALGAKLVGVAPNDTELHLFYGRMLRDQRRFSEAANQFLAAAKIRPDSLEAWNELAAALIIGEQYSQGLVALDRVKALGGESVGQLFQRALAQDHLQLRPEAIESYNRFLAASQGKLPDQEFQARQRIRNLENELKKKK